MSVPVVTRAWIIAEVAVYACCWVALAAFIYATESTTAEAAAWFFAGNLTANRAYATIARIDKLDRKDEP